MFFSSTNFLVGSSYFANPEFGVEFTIEESQPSQPTTRLESRVDDIEILQSREHTDSYAVSFRLK